MKALTRKYLFLPLIVLFCGVYQVLPHKTDTDASGLSVSTVHPGARHRYFSKESHSRTGETPAFEIVEQTSHTFQKDLAGDSSFGWLTLKDHTYSVLELLSEQLSRHKPFLTVHFSEALYLVIRILRL